MTGSCVNIMDEDDAAAFIGEKVIEMADRLRPVAAITPGVLATYAFEMDGVTYEVTVKVRA